jgi:hypothetical protein
MICKIKPLNRQNKPQSHITLKAHGGCYSRRWWNDEFSFSIFGSLNEYSLLTDSLAAADDLLGV